MGEQFAPPDVLTRLLVRAERFGRRDQLLLKRRHPRYTSPDGYFLRTGQDGSPEVYVRGYNISAEGLCVLGHEPVPADTEVALQSESASAEDPWLAARVMHCTQTVGGYKIGMRFAP